ncbi:zinc finger protein 1 homolog isoform X3 [Bicyclus anynana]|uniref:Zinc finger protein 1 homolog isoform X3 n=1 Tax=Bicyclus anynana TaxID=110368 RepID=A0A6J1N417_BICAN|nr:zinc finger protein 1 homolog isoform X3 [Bicyclus anynana]
MKMSKIKKPGQQQQCRCCLEVIGLKDLWTEYYNGDEREVYGEMVNECFAMPWEHEDSKREYICDGCVTRLRDAVSFRKEILHSDQLLKEHIKNEAVAGHSVKEEEMSDAEIETEYLSIDYLDEDGQHKSNSSIEIKIESGGIKEESIPSKSGRRYTEEDFKKCIEAVKSRKLSQTKASIIYHVPRTTIRHALASIKKEEDKAKREKRSSPNKAKQEEMRKHGDNIYTLFTYTNATPIRCKNDFGYACCFCAEVYQEPNILKDHTIKCHEYEMRTKFMEGKRLGDYLVKLDITNLECNICNAGLKSLDEAFAHLKEHNKPMHLDINNHIMPFKFEGEELKCVYCKVVFNKFKKLLEHMNRHYRNCVCDICGAGFINRSTFTVHYHGHSLGHFPCHHCEKVFDTKRKQRSHEMAIHIHAQKSYKCGYCNEHFSTHWKKEKHISSEHGVNLREIKCQVCDKVCLTANSLRIHVKRDHLKERRFECKVCDYRFFGSQELREHMVKHTGIRDYKCDICLKSYGKKSTLREHIRIHADDRRFKCGHCDLAFIQKCSLNNHLRSKHGYVRVQS